MQPRQPANGMNAIHRATSLPSLVAEGAGVPQGDDPASAPGAVGPPPPGLHLQSPTAPHQFRGGNER